MGVRPSRVRRLRVRKAVGNAALAGVVAAAGMGYLAVQKTVTLVVEGRPEAVRTMSASVGELLDARGIVLGTEDLVVPPPATPLADGMTVLVDHGYLARSASSPPGDVGVWVMEGMREPRSLLPALRVEKHWLSAGGPVGSSEVTAVRVVVMGKDHDVVTNATTVRELLSAMGIEPDRDDRVLPSPGAHLRPSSTVRYLRIERRVREVEVPIPYTTSTSFSDELKAGQVKILRPGVDGLMRERYRERVVNGEVVSRTLLSRTVVREAVAAERLVGRRNASHGTQVGEASWYSFAPGDGLTAAHPWLPFGTVVTVTNLANGTSVRVVINDRGPFGGRIIDLSDEAFARIAPLGQGVCRVRLAW
ncbi:MAG TPA: ubiquitin-like domain-containing protein [Actinomycetota bacterium]